MNLGQAIDPEWVQAGKPERFPKPRPKEAGAPADVPPTQSARAMRDADRLLGYVTTSPAEERISMPRPRAAAPAKPRPPVVAKPTRSAGSRLTHVERVTLALGASETAVSGPRLVKDTGVNGTAVYNALSRLKARKLVEVSGTGRSHTYRLTPDGRAEAVGIKKRVS